MSSKANIHEVAFFFGGRENTDLPALMAAGRHPQVEYLAFLEMYGARLIAFDDVDIAASPFVRTIAAQAGPYWGLAALSRMQQKTISAALTTGEDVGLPMALLQRLTGGTLPLFIITHGSYLGSRKGALALTLLRRMPSVRFLCLSETLRQRLIRHHAIPVSRVCNAGYGVDTNFFQPDPRVPIMPRQIASAGMAKRDYKTLVAATANLRDVTVKIAADSAWFRADTDISGLPLPPHVEARSFGDYLGLRRLYAESAFVVVPLYEATHACGYAVIAEAMAMGKPVITTRITGHSDYVIEGETGFYVPPGDAGALRERIRELLDNPAKAQEMGRNARRLMEDKFSLDAYVGRIAQAMGLTVPDTTEKVRHAAAPIGAYNL